MLRSLSNRTFLKKPNNPFNNTIEEDTDVLVSKPSEIIEKQFIDEYFLVVRRVQGIGLSLNDFWNMDIDTFSQILNNEREIIKEEQKQYEKQRLESKSTSKTGKMTTPKFEDSEEYLDIYESLIEEA